MKGVRAHEEQRERFLQAQQRSAQQQPVAGPSQQSQQQWQHKTVSDRTTLKRTRIERSDGNETAEDAEISPPAPKRFVTHRATMSAHPTMDGNGGYNIERILQLVQCSSSSSAQVNVHDDTTSSSSQGELDGDNNNLERECGEQM